MSKSNSPSPTGAYGRGSTGRFAPGNKLARGNPFAKRVAELRTALYGAVTAEDLKAVVHALLSAAKEGDISASRELFQRLLGPAESIDLIDRLDALERRLDLGREGEGHDA